MCVFQLSDSIHFEPGLNWIQCDNNPRCNALGYNYAKPHANTLTFDTQNACLKRLFLVKFYIYKMTFNVFCLGAYLCGPLTLFGYVLDIQK